MIDETIKLKPKSKISDDGKRSTMVKIDKRFMMESGKTIFNGNEILAKGLLEVEGGTHIWTGYPGSPIAAFFDMMKRLKHLLKEKGIKGIQANNEALGAAMANGSQMTSLRTAVAMKSVGLHVASDAFYLGNLAGAHPNGGVVAIVGDDPWCESTQVPSDSRFLAQHMQMPVIEPSTMQEIKDWLNVSFKLSQRSAFYICYIITTPQADGGSSVDVYPNHYPVVNTNFPIDLDSANIVENDLVMLPPSTSIAEAKLDLRRQTLWKEAKRLNLNKILYNNKNKSFGFITSGNVYNYLEQALSELGLEARYPILKLGLTYPINSEDIFSFATGKDTLIVVEEKRSFVEQQVLNILSHNNNEKSKELKLHSDLKVYGKKFPQPFKGFSEVGGLNTTIIKETIGPVVRLLDESLKQDQKVSSLINKELKLIRELQESVSFSVAERTPTFCPGCPHRDSSSVLKQIQTDFLNAEYMKKKHKQKPVDLIFHGDTGCYSLLKYAPNTGLMLNYSGMGLGGGSGTGVDKFIKNKQAVFMGDSTFFHSGIVSISNAIQNNQDITYIILDNSTTAMTGHQTTPNSGKDAMDDKTYLQDIMPVVNSLTKKYKLPVYRMNPEIWDKYRKVLEKCLLDDGVKIIIADKECGILYNRQKSAIENNVLRKKGYLPSKEYMNITEEVCEYCLECTNTTGCPGLTIKETMYGPKIQTDFSTCVDDGACSKAKVCPSFEKVIVKRKNRPKHNLIDTIKFTDLTDPTLKTFKDKYSIFVCGIGGMGLGVTSSILTLAGVKDGYNVSFCDKKGLAIRNGGIYASIVYSKKVKPHSPMISVGKANLIIGFDLLEAARSLTSKHIGSRQRTQAVINTAYTPTVETLMGKTKVDQQELQKIILNYIKHDKDATFMNNLSKISEKYFGSRLYTNLIVLGVAYQKGLLPIKESSLYQAIESYVKKDQVGKNKKAFLLGRKVSLYPELFYDKSQVLTYSAYKAYLLGRLKHDYIYGNKNYVAKTFVNLLAVIEQESNLDDETKKAICRRIYDLIWYSGLPYAKKYLQLVMRVLKKDNIKKEKLEATKAVVLGLAKVMIIKDEFYVSHQLTDKEKLERDKERYNVDISNGDTIQYIHFNRPAFDIGSFKIEFDIKPRNWLLNLMKRLRWIRPLLPHWHSKERNFCNWYINLVNGFFYNNDSKVYKKWIELLKLPLEVTGYREVRYPKEEQVKQKAQQLLNEIHQSSNHHLSNDITSNTSLKQQDKSHQMPKK